jgi:AraC-like DNA-binding protein
VQIDLTPMGAYRLLGLPMSEIANRVVDLSAVWGRQAAELGDRMASAPDWAARLDVVDELLLRWSEDGPSPDPAVIWAWNQLDRSNGMVSVSALAEEIGWSRRHFASRFREQVGLSPKPAGRVLRFRRAVELLTAASEAPPERQPTIADVAAECGYADHSHLVRECKVLSGVTPSELMGAVLPEGSGVTG